MVAAKCRLALRTPSHGELARSLFVAGFTTGHQSRLLRDILGQGGGASTWDLGLCVTQRTADALIGGRHEHIVDARPTQTVHAQQKTRVRQRSKTRCANSI